MTLVIPQQATSVALGLAYTAENVLLSILPGVFGYINEDRTITAYNNSLYILRILGIVAFFGSLVVMLVDFKTGSRLHLPENHEKVLEAKTQATENFRNSTVIMTDSFMKTERGMSMTGSYSS